jgi:tRNA (guanine-N7-)-methyltransferase
VRSFVLRQGRMSPAQTRALADLWPKYGIDYAPQPLDFARVFGRRAPVILEIGFGMGETSALIAASRADHDFVGVEVHAPGVGALLAKIDHQKLANVRVVRHDAVEVVAHMVAPGSLAGVHVFFPDPWPKKRHHKRRLLTPAFVHALAQRLSPGGYCMQRPTGRTTRTRCSPRLRPSRCSRTRPKASRRVLSRGR